MIIFATNYPKESNTHLYIRPVCIKEIYGKEYFVFVLKSISAEIFVLNFFPRFFSFHNF